MNGRNLRHLREVWVWAILAAAVLLTAGCSGFGTAGKVAVTPLTAVRDVVDVPLVSVTNGFKFFSDRTRPATAPHVGVGWTWRSGINFGVGYDLSHYVFKAFSGVFGAMDYVVCRSIWPNFAEGISPWRGEGQSWGSLYFPNTRVLWGDDRPMFLPKTPSGGKTDAAAR